MAVVIHYPLCVSSSRCSINTVSVEWGEDGRAELRPSHLGGLRHSGVCQIETSQRPHSLEHPEHAGISIRQSWGRALEGHKPRCQALASVSSGGGAPFQAALFFKQCLQTHDLGTVYTHSCSVPLPESAGRPSRCALGNVSPCSGSGGRVKMCIGTHFLLSKRPWGAPTPVRFRGSQLPHTAPLSSPGNSSGGLGSQSTWDEQGPGG